MLRTIKDVFEAVGKDFHVNERLLKALQQFEHNFTHRNGEHIDFFGGHLLGVEKVRFLPSDWATLFDDVFELDDTELEKQFHLLPNTYKAGKVSSDILNLTCFWVVFKILNTKPGKGMSKEQLYNGALNAVLIFQYKVLTSKIANDFKFTANRDLMTTVYASLSMKFSIKQYGSWSALLRARAVDILSDNSIHYHALRFMDNDERFQYVITDSQGRLKEIVKKHWDTINAVQESHNLIVTGTATMDTPDGISVKELDRHFPTYTNYLHSIVGEPTNFIKDDLMRIIADAVHTMSPIYLRTVLTHISENYQQDGGLIEETLNDIMTHAYEFLRTRYKGSMSTPDLALILTEIKGVYMSARSTDSALLKLRVNIDKVIGRKLKNISPAATAALRVGIALYVILRTLTKKKYAA